jgi:hypothetical protein
MLPILLLSLGLGLSGCKSSGSDHLPTPTTSASIVGRWSLITSRAVEIAPSNAIVSDQTTAIANVPVEFTTTQCIFNPGSTGSKTLNYTLVNNILIYSSGEQYTVQELSATKLIIGTISTTAPPPNRVIITLTYTR